MGRASVLKSPGASFLTSEKSESWMMAPNTSISKDGTWILTARISAKPPQLWGIVKFRGTKRIDSLEAFPLQYHPNEKGVRRELIDCGRKFLAFGESHHQQYEGVAFFKTRRELIKVSINGRIMVDASLFFKTNPNYTKPRFDENRRSNSLDIWMDFVGQPDKIKKHSLDPAAASDDDLPICSPHGVRIQS
jgi:hypothetical protein